MRRILSAALLALSLAGYASADYLLIVVNLNAKEEGATGGGQAGNPGPGMPPGPGPGMPPGMPPGPGRPPMPGGGGPPPMPGGGMPPPLGGVGGVGGPAQPEEADDSPDLIVVVLEAKNLNPKVSPMLFNEGKLLAPAKFRHKWGDVDLVSKIPLTKWAAADVTVLEKTKGTPLATVKERFEARKKDEMTPDKSASTVIDRVARFALELGLVDECGKVMDELVAKDKDKTNASLKAYAAVKAELDKPVANLDSFPAWQTKLLNGYKVTQNDKGHFALLHLQTKRSAEDVKPHLDQLERTYRAYYYWWALRGVVLPVAKERQTAVLAETEHFKNLRESLTASPVLADSFHARREAASVFASTRMDLPYDKLRKEWSQNWGDFDRHEILAGDKLNKGVPKVDKSNRPLSAIQRQQAGQIPRVAALVLKLMEYEHEQTAITHEASRQLLYSSKLLPRNVNAPEWIQFGMGAFFEAPLQSPWPSVGAANPYWMPRFKELKAKNKYEPAAVLLKKVVTDGHFREKAKSTKHEDVEAHLRRARAAAWSLTYFVARTDSTLPKLRRYFAELSKLPRDVALDEKTLWNCFAKAFELDTDDKVLSLANRWLSYVENETLDASAVHERIRKAYAEMNAPKTPPKQGGGIGGGVGGIGGNLGGTGLPMRP